MSDPHAYFLAIEEVFLEHRGAPLQLSPKDWQVAREWHDAGIPLELVEREIRELFERRSHDDADRVWGLAYCSRAVKAAWRRQQQLQAPATGGEDETLDIGARLGNLAAALPDSAPNRGALATRIRGLEGSAEAVEAELVRLDREIVRVMTEALDPSVAAEIAAELERSLSALRDRLPVDELERAGDRLREEILRRRLGLPVLSLFAPEAVGACNPEPSVQA